MELYIGLMSGTSVDGVDAALVDFSETKPRLVASHYVPYDINLQKKIQGLSQQEDQIQELGELDSLLGQLFAKTANELLNQQKLSAEDIIAIGSHGQTIRHHPQKPYPFTLQIGDPNIIACATGITTVADFRRKDMAFGGEGAPLVPAFHHHVFSSDHISRAVINIGGIANVTFLLNDTKHENHIIGFDTGPGNVLINAWIKKHKNKSYDMNGAWGAEGNINQELLERLLSDAYYHRAPPKSSGPEYFHLTWLQKYLDLQNTTITPIDVQATLVEMGARSMMFAVKKYCKQGEVFICGGGSHNQFLLTRLKANASNNFTVQSTKTLGIDPDFIEAMAFAWLAKQTLDRKPGNLPSVTGANKATVLGGIYYGG